MTGQYPSDTAETTARPASNGTDTLLWIVLVLALVVNGGLSLIGLDLLAVPFGAVAIFSGAALLIRFFQRRR
ncbi:hypothetical protein [Glycomyces arizonensis]|uniref:hypothetical protein n=1 Tax=Glycomyces arizonensis TaxID=256035 RepID=UPI0003F75FAB|nr:hypothetical protein [Glycomyces arizonensis]